MTGRHTIVWGNRSRDPIIWGNRPQMMFTDPRFRSPSALGSFGLTYACDSVRAAQSELQSLLEQAKAARLLIPHWFGHDEGHPTAVAAQVTFDQVKNENLVVFTDAACDEWTARLETASNQLRELLAYAGTEQITYVPPAESPYERPSSDTLDKLKPLFISVAVVAGVVVVAPIVFELVGLAKTSRRLGRRR